MDFFYFFTGSANVPIRGPGDGMETEKPLLISDSLLHCPSEVSTVKVTTPKCSPKSIRPASPQPHGVLHLGKVSREACTEVEAVRIIVPRAAISRCSHAGVAESKGESGQQSEEQGSLQVSPVDDWRRQLDKLQNSERRLLQDKEGLSNQLRVQTEVSCFNCLRIMCSLCD